VAAETVTPPVATLDVLLMVDLSPEMQKPPGGGLDVEKISD